MIQSRKSIFETNSSSTHAITIANNGEDDFKKNLPEELVFEVGEFGWEFVRYCDVQSRADYLFTAILYTSTCDDYIPKIKDILSKWNIEAIFPEVIKKQSEYGAKGWYDCLASEESGDNWGTYYYIDHGYELDDFLKKVCNDETLLMNYLFSDESFIATGNDNTDRELDCETNAKNVLLDYYKGN